MTTIDRSARGVTPFVAQEHAWDDETILRVRAKHEAEIAASPNLESLLARLRSNVYQGGPLRCIPELIQNAQDEGGSELRFVLEADAILVYNDGDSFKSYQVEDICSVARSHKDESQIGWMGLGFKSVFTVSDHPQVVSGAYNFEFEDLIIPQPANRVIESEWLPTFNPARGAWV